MRAQLLGRAIERAGLGREPDEVRARDHGPRGGLAVAVGAADDPGELGQDVRGRFELERQAVAALDLLVGRWLRRPEVGDGRGHDQGIEAGRAVRPVGEAQQRGAQLGRRLDADDLGAVGEGHLEVGGDDRDLRPAVERRGRDGGAHPARGAVADEAHGIDRPRASRRR